MSMTGYGVANYKAFQNIASIDLKPLTLLFGYNSAGKSALLRTLPLLRDATLWERKNPIPLKSEAARGATFDDLKCQLSSNPVITFELKFDEEFSRYWIYIRDLPDIKRQIVEKAVIINDRGRPVLTMEWLPPEEGNELTYNEYRCQLFREDKIREATLKLDFLGIIPEPAENRVGQVHIISIIHKLRRILRSSAQSVYWLKALRCVPPRREVFEGAPDRMLSDGSGATQLLAYDDLQGGKVLADVASWYRDSTGNEFTIKRGAFSGTELISATLTPTAGGASVSIADTGEGMGQVLPILTLLSLARHGQLGSKPILAIEHPELHLHPYAHPSLADLFCSAASIDEPPYIIVETHSENFLLAVQLAIIQKRVDASAVGVYWVRQNEAGGIADPITFDELGRPVGDKWPPGLFNESTLQSRQIVKARRDRESR